MALLTDMRTIITSTSPTTLNGWKQLTAVSLPTCIILHYLRSEENNEKSWGGSVFVLIVGSISLGVTRPEIVYQP